MKKEKKISLSFINKGEPFLIPNMTVQRHEEYTEMMKKLEKEIKNKDKRDRELTKVLVMKTLQIVDSTVTMDDINNMHPADFIYISNQVWERGKEILVGEDTDFRVKK